MIKLIDLLFEHGPNGLPEPVMIQLVFWDSKNGLKDIKKQKEIFRILERNLKASQYTLSYSIPNIMNGIKYYPSTDKIVGLFPKSIFLHPNYLNKIGKNSLMNMDKCRFKDELMKVSRTLEVKQK
jgi:hypothetical protein